MAKKRGSPKKGTPSKSPSKSPSKASRATPSKTAAASKSKTAPQPDVEAKKHVLGRAESRKLAEMHLNSLKILRDACGRCGKQSKPSDKFIHAAVCPLESFDGKYRPMSNVIYVVRCEDLRYSKQVVWGLEEDGKERVSFFF